MKFKEHILLYTIVPLIFFSIGASFVRFIILNDYLVSYEGTCDPYTQNCFIGCEDDECAQVYYFNRVQKFAVNLKNQCGENITDCKKQDMFLKLHDIVDK